MRSRRSFLRRSISSTATAHHLVCGNRRDPDISVNAFVQSSLDPISDGISLLYVTEGVGVQDDHPS